MSVYYLYHGKYTLINFFWKNNLSLKALLKLYLFLQIFFNSQLQRVQIKILFDIISLSVHFIKSCVQLYSRGSNNLVGFENILQSSMNVDGSLSCCWYLIRTLSHKTHLSTGSGNLPARDRHNTGHCPVGPLELVLRSESSTHIIQIRGQATEQGIMPVTSWWTPIW